MKSTICRIMLACCFASGCQAQKPAQAMTPITAPVKIELLKITAIRTIKEGLSDKNPYTRIHAIEIAIETQQKQIISDIIQLIEDTIIPVRFTAILAVGEMNCVTCQEKINQVLLDKNENVQIAAAYSLIKLGDSSHLDIIRKAAVSADPTVRANALLLLGKLKNKDDINIVYKALTEINSPDKVKMQAVDSLARLKDNRIYRTKLWPLLISKYADDRVMGIRGMGLLATSEAREAIQTMLQDDVMEVKLCAAEELGKLGDKSGLKVLTEYFTTNPDLNKANMASGTALMAIGRINALSLSGYLDKALQSTAPYNQLAAAQSILLMLEPPVMSK